MWRIGKKEMFRKNIAEVKNVSGEKPRKTIENDETLTKEEGDSGEIEGHYVVAVRRWI